LLHTSSLARDAASGPTTRAREPGPIGEAFPDDPLPVPPDIGPEAVVAMRRRMLGLRLVLMGIIAVLLGTVGGWPYAAPWLAAYSAMQALLTFVDMRSDRFGYGPIYVGSFLSFLLVGAPTWHLWTQVGPVGVAAATMFLCGMLAQLVASSLGARKLFVAQATPLVGYLIIVPTLATGRTDPVMAAALAACSLTFLVYLGALWRGQQGVLQALAESQAAAEAASRAKTEFLATISHEIRTPMNAVLGASDLLARGELLPEQREHVQVLRDAGLVLTQVLNDVLDLAKIEAGKLQVEPSKVDIGRLLRRCAAVWRPRAEDAGLRLDIEVEALNRRFVEIDSLRTGQILFNLLSNAIKFTPAGVVQVTATLTETGEGEGEGGVRRAELTLTVTDTGIGMSPRVMARLFAPFEQADGSITRRFGGSGLGLAIGQKLAGLMGGRIAAESQEGRGSTFTLTLPCALCEPDAPRLDAGPREAPTKDAPLDGLRVLLAEDNAANQRIIEHFLRPIGAELTIVTDGQQAVERLAVELFDVVLMDLQMPVMDGLEATRRIRAGSGPNRSIPILALTANVMDSAKQACTEAGMTGHIAKPIDARLLLSAVLSVGLVRTAEPVAAA
jgi:signal transduction histidine kinase